MITSCIENLTEIKHLCEKLAPTAFAQPLEILSGSSLGQHIRHIVELYQAVENARFSGIVNYDDRKRNPLIETNPEFAAGQIHCLLEFLKEIPSDKSLILTGDFGIEGDTIVQIKTSLFRELAYNLEHSIHHQALIKIGLNSLKLGSLIDDNFGVAPATIRFRKSKEKVAAT